MNAHTFTPSAIATAEPVEHITWIAAECMTIAMTKALTDWVAQAGYGVFLAEPEAAGARGALYIKAGLQGDSTPERDRDAARRLKIWFWRVREIEQ